MAVDHFKIVAMLKQKGKSKVISYTFVPHMWEENGELSWPRSNLTALRKDAGSVPEPNWLLYNCKLKKDNILTVDEAQLWEEEYIKAPDTDAEDSLTIDTNLINIDQIVHKSSNKSKKSKEIASIDELFTKLNEDNPLLCSIHEDGNVRPIQYEVIPDTDASETEVFHAISDKTSDEINNLLLDEMFQKVKSIDTNQTRLQERFDTEFLQIKATLDKIYSLLKNINNGGSVTDRNNDLNMNTQPTFAQKFKFPLNTVQDIHNFNKEISTNREYKTFLISTYSSIFGIDGNEDGKIVAKKMLNIFFSKYVLTLFSWTGISRTAGIDKKAAFQSMEAIISLFLKVIGLADSRWSDNKNEKFFKAHTLKHAKQINAAYEKKTQKEGNDIGNDQETENLRNNEEEQIQPDQDFFDDNDENDGNLINIVNGDEI